MIVKAIHSELIQRYGGSYGLRDAALLESAIARPRQLAHYNGKASVAELAAVLGWGLIKNNAFVDGKKRIGLAAMVTFLTRNGCRFTCPEIEETAMVLRAAASEIDETQWTAWVVQRVAAL
jgi:death-on-curing protein